MAGFESAVGKLPGIEMAGFGGSAPVLTGVLVTVGARKYLPTVSQLSPSSRAMARLDQPAWCSVKIDCCSFNLS